MKFSTYQKMSELTRTPAPQMTQDQLDLLKIALGLTEEAGEVAHEIKEHVIKGKELDKAALTLELGDVLYYLIWMADSAGISMKDVFAENVKKLEARWLAPQDFVTLEKIESDLES